MSWYNAQGEELGAVVALKDESGNIIGWKFNPAEDTEWRVENGYIYDHNPVPPPPPPPQPEPEPQPPQTVFTKLKIRRAMRVLGLEGQLNAILASDATFAADWGDAQEIDLADPVMVAALAAAEITEAEIELVRKTIENGGVPPTPPPEPTPEPTPTPAPEPEPTEEPTEEGGAEDEPTEPEAEPVVEEAPEAEVEQEEEPSAEAEA